MIQTGCDVKSRIEKKTYFLVSMGQGEVEPPGMARSPGTRSNPGLSGGLICESVREPLCPTGNHRDREAGLPVCFTENGCNGKIRIYKFL